MRGGDLLVGSDVLQFRQFLHRLFDDRRPMIEFVAIGIGQRVLVLRTTEPAAEADILPRLHEKLYSFDLSNFGAKPLNDLVGGAIALIMGF